MKTRLHPRLPAAARIGLIYLVLASLWIWGSDWLLLHLWADALALRQMQSWKGELFVLVTTGLLFILVYREERTQAAIRSELARTRDQLEHTVDVSGTVIYALVPSSPGRDEWSIAYVSGNLERLTGYSVAQWQSQPDFWLQHVHPEDRPVAAAAQRELHEQRKLRHQYRFLRGDGQYRWIDDEASLSRDARGRAVEIVGSWRDITAQENLRQALRDRQIVLDTFIEHAPAALAMFDRQMRYQRASQRWLDDFNLPAGELPGRSHYDFFPALPEDIKAAHRRALAGEVVPSEEICLVQVDGREQWLQREIRPCRGADGQVDSIIIFSEDITQRKLDRLQLQDAQRRWQFAVDGSDLGLWDWNLADDTIFYSTRWKSMLGHAEDEIGDQIGEWEARVHPDDRTRVVTELQQHLQGFSEFYCCEHRVRCRDGGYKWIMDRGQVILRDGQGQALRMIGTQTDLTALKQREEALALSADVFEHSAEAIVICAPDNTILTVNQAYSDITGYAAAEVVGLNPGLLKSGHHERDFYLTMWHQLHETGRWQGEILNRRKNGDVFVAWLAINLVRDADGLIRHYYAIFSDISQRKETEARIIHMQHHDALTDLPNRVLLCDRIGLAIAHAQRTHEQLAVMIIGLDRFKNINDSLGLGAGDAVIVEVAARLMQITRQQDTVSRMSGDEFTLLLPQTGSDGAVHLAHKISEAVAQPLHAADHELIVTPSIGIALYPLDGRNVDALLQSGDAALRRAKLAGGNNFQFSDPAMLQQTSRTLRIENGLRHALGRGELDLHYQPQIDLASGRLVGCEALLRWKHPELGVVAPADFIPVAEESGLILPIGEWAIRTAVARNKAWQEAGLPPIVVAVNVSAMQFRRDDFPERVRQILAEAGLSPCWLGLELTESVMSEDPEQAIRSMEELNAQGIQLAIDDFGTGYSSLAYLKRLRINKLKIDQSFVRDCITDAGSASIMSGTIVMAHSMGLKTIAEGVETIGQVVALKDMGCDEAQGYGYGKPMTADAFAQWVRAWLA